METRMETREYLHHGWPSHRSQALCGQAVHAGFLSLEPSGGALEQRLSCRVLDRYRSDPVYYTILGSGMGWHEKFPSVYITSFVHWDELAIHKEDIFDLFNRSNPLTGFAGGVEEDTGLSEIYKPAKC